MMKRFTVAILVAVLSLVFLLAPAVMEARGGRGGGGGRGGSHGSGKSHGGGSGGHHGGYSGGYHGGYPGKPANGGKFFGYVPVVGFGGGFLAPGYWADGYYYANPYYGVCQRWVPTGDYHMESRQDPDTGAWEEVPVPDGYWEVIPCN